MKSIFMGDPKTPRYKILNSLNKYHALGFSDLGRESGVCDYTLNRNIKRLIEERIVNKWDFGVRALYAHCFVPWYEVQEIYNKKYLAKSKFRAPTKIRRRRMLEHVLKD